MKSAGQKGKPKEEDAIIYEVLMPAEKIIITFSLEHDLFTASKSRQVRRMCGVYSREGKKIREEFLSFD